MLSTTHECNADGMHDGRLRQRTTAPTRNSLTHLYTFHKLSYKVLTMVPNTTILLTHALLINLLLSYLLNLRSGTFSLSLRKGFKYLTLVR